MIYIAHLAAEAGLAFKVASTTVFPPTTSAYTSASYADLLNGSGGSIISVSYTKLHADTGMLIRTGLSCRMNDIARHVHLGVNDGTTDHDIAVGWNNRIGIGKWHMGERVITGLAAGSYTFKMRVRLGSAGATLHFASSNTAFLSVAEVP